MKRVKHILPRVHRGNISRFLISESAAVELFMAIPADQDS